MTNATTMTKLLRFWLPLQATWLMMAFEGPFLAAIIARLAEPKHNLAAFGVSFALAIIVEAPVIMMMSASTALVDSRANYRRLLGFTWWLNGGITVVMLILLLTPVWPLVALDAIGLDPEVARLAHTALLILLPWPAAIGFRRFCQGLLIRAGHTKRVAWGTVIRLAAMAGGALAARLLTEMPGASVGAVGMSAGVVCEAIASRWMARGVIRDLADPPAPAPTDPAAIADHGPQTGALLSYRKIIEFYTPLALTSTIALVVLPLVTFFMGQARNALESLAVLPVINSLVFIFRTPGLSFQEVAIAMLGRSWNNLAMVRRFATMLALISTAILALIALTPMSRVWFGTVSGLSDELMGFTALPIRILIPIPLLSVLLSWQRALLVAGHRTGPVSWASAIEVAGVFTVLYLAIEWGDWIGVTAAATALVCGRLAGNAFLVPGMRRAGPPTTTS